ncbi:hypothetical protein FCH28_21780 [Streptomyces piniterrae]|uniref:Uncharacterized protein n=1 Tax=Streptomyces piniterrae TaxID=2571125 RepID=A0A4U0NBB2_9ACTN|nr:hypothetical protein [Streptomyces piniterrae]TJZ51126.1 hypothetical protein FCH28_21780 [Streptomyces piniterrae]
MRLRLPQERPAEPPRGYKIAHPVRSHDGRRIGFAGVSIGGAAPYGVVDEARCVYGRRHRSPALRCDCGFHCLHTLTDALALTCADAYRRAALLEVTVLGVYIRFERGMRYARQRVRVVRVGPCCCGLPPEVFVDAGWGRTGWRVLTGACAGCAAGRDMVGFAEFARLSGGRLRVLPGYLHTEGEGEGGAEVAGRAAGPAVRTVAEMAAEASLMQARVDWLQGRLARLTGDVTDPL